MNAAPSSPPRRWTVLGLLEWTAGHLAQKGFDEARLTVDLLLAHVLRMRRLDLYLQFDRILEAGELAAFKILYERRLTHEPLQYILGETEFMGLRLAIGPAVLIPRPETEQLVELALGEAGGFGKEDLEILDIGTGSGNIALALARRLPRASITSMDVSREALALAARNAAGNGITSVRFLEADIFADEPAGLSFDLIVSNPPYVPARDFEQLGAEVRDYEPRQAVTDGGDGLRFYGRIARRAKALLRERGAVLVEIGCGQAEAVRALFEREGFREVLVHRDYAEIERVICARLP
jgi:release factor glutamine methyltransferase